MKTIAFPTQDYDYTTYFTLEGQGGAFYLYPDLAKLTADHVDYADAQSAHIDSLVPIQDGEWVLIDGKEHVTVITDDEHPATFIPADSLPCMVMDGAGFLTINGHTLRDFKGRITDESVDEEGGRWRLGYALRTAQLEGHVPADCEYVLDGSGSYYKINKA